MVSRKERKEKAARKGREGCFRAKGAKMVSRKGWFHAEFAKKRVEREVRKEKFYAKGGKKKRRAREV